MKGRPRRPDRRALMGARVRPARGRPHPVWHHGRVREVELSRPIGVRYLPDLPNGVGVLVLAGSSGRVDAGRARVFAELGAVAESVQWFGGPGQHAGPWEIPVEVFLERVRSLAQDCDRVVVCGTSLGSEAALLTGVHAPEVDAVIGFSPSDVLWSGTTPVGTVTSHWTLDGQPLPYVPVSASWTPDTDPPAYVRLYEQSYREAGAATEPASIAVEAIGEVLLIAGDDDRVWPSVTQAGRIVARRQRHGLGTSLVRGVGAGHRAVLPGESVPVGGMRMARGGTEEADRALGRAAMPHIRFVLGLKGPQSTHAE